MYELNFELDWVKPHVIEAVGLIFASQTGQTLPIDSSAEEQFFTPTKNAIGNIFRLGKQGTDFAAINIASGLRACTFWDKRRNFKKNDFYDVGHAQAAIPYCDLFFTEKNLKSDSMSGKLRYDKIFNCKIVSKPADALECLESGLIT